MAIPMDRVAQLHKEMDHTPESPQTVRKFGLDESSSPASPKTPSARPGLHNLFKLFTREDDKMFHKSFGLFALTNFVYRYAVVYNRTGTLGYDGSHLDWASMIVHTLLACSSIIFRVPKKRINDKPMIIYEEYRQHAMVFTLRCMTVFAIAVSFPKAPAYVIPIAVACWHMKADAITRKHGAPGNTAVRALREKTSPFYQKVGLFYSFYQFLAIGSHLSPNARLADLGFNALIAIQSSAFMMTLYRKKIIRGRVHMGVYSFCLVLSTFHICRLCGWKMVAAVAVTFATRITLRVDKYILWTMYLLAPVAFTYAQQYTLSSTGP